MESILSTIIDKFNSCAHYLTNSITSKINIMSPIKIENQLSDIMSSLFENTKVNVYLLSSNEINTCTIPGQFTHFAQDSFIYNIGIIGPIIANFGNLILSFYNNIDKVNESKYLEYNPTTNKFKCNIPYISAFITTTAVDKLTQNEIIAILLHEVGHNTLIGLNLMEELCKLPLKLGIGVSALVLILNKVNDNRDNYDNDYLKLFAPLLLLSMFIYYIGCYYARRQELYSDEFAIKMGYGNALKSALDKCLNYRAKSNINIGIVTKIMYYVLYVFKSIGFSNYPNNDERLNAIVRKTNSYDTSKNNINRTNNIDYY